MEYVKERASLCELTKAVRAWERKVEIAEVGFELESLLTLINFIVALALS
jgi:hypothetical protein